MNFNFYEAMADRILDSLYSRDVQLLSRAVMKVNDLYPSSEEEKDAFIEGMIFALCFSYDKDPEQVREDLSLEMSLKEIGI